MSKYINADRLIQHLSDWRFGDNLEAFPCNELIEAIENSPAADVVEVIRCKDCKYNYGIANNCEYAKDDIVCCYWESDGLHSDDFCSRGERKETE